METESVISYITLFQMHRLYICENAGLGGCREMQEWVVVLYQFAILHS